MLEKWIVRHWIALCVGCVLMGFALRIAYAERGRMGFGGEWLIIPMVFAVERHIRKCRRRRNARVRRCAERTGTRRVSSER